MLDLQREQLLSLAQAARYVPGGVHVSTLHRWCLRGVKGVRLETARLGGRRVTSVEAISRFFRATTLATSDDFPIRSAESTHARTERIERANAELDRAGI